MCGDAVTASCCWGERGVWSQWLICSLASWLGLFRSGPESNGDVDSYLPGSGHREQMLYLVTWALVHLRLSGSHPLTGHNPWNAYGSSLNARPGWAGNQPPRIEVFGIPSLDLWLSLTCLSQTQQEKVGCPVPSTHVCSSCCHQRSCKLDSLVCALGGSGQCEPESSSVWVWGAGP